MREIKFRAWSHEEGQFIYAEPVYGFFPSLKMDEENGKNLAERYSDIQEYTGLKDDNDADVYEGDILENEDYVGQVVWDDEHSRFILESRTDGSTGIIQGVATHSPISGDVIGNIYENPDLL